MFSNIMMTSKYLFDRAKIILDIFFNDIFFLDISFNDRKLKFLNYDDDSNVMLNTILKKN